MTKKEYNRHCGSTKWNKEREERKKIMCKENLKPKYPNLEGEIAKQGYNKTSFSREIDMTPNQLSNRLDGEIDFRLNEILNISDVLGKDIRYLFTTNE